jgi:spore coat protein JB
MNNNSLENCDISAPSENLDRNELLKQLTCLDFMALDLHLYLDTHPNDKNALAKYNCTIVQADALRNMYQSNYGPLYSYRSPSSYPWQWIKEPWPWNKNFNFELTGEET